MKTKKVNKKVVKQMPFVPKDKPYVPVAHPQQVRIDDIRVIPSLVTSNKHIPMGK
jgi:hypothetical protein